MEESRHGRAWTVYELRDRDWETLQQLWWVCVKERNRLATAKLEHKRVEAGYGEMEMDKRDKTVQETMKAILDTLAERNNAYQEAYKLARNDPTIDLNRAEHQFQEPTYAVDEMYDESELDDPTGVVPKEAFEEQNLKSATATPSKPSTESVLSTTKEQAKQLNMS